ncbi:MAG: BrnA antitoxin family protein [Pyrinomonadaceae bacterium MAG19_C2-C3]|nr:BrnA antitoxin family protein [Pyrinomonadaceae bacterium MAG19_C2-C3]
MNTTDKELTYTVTEEEYQEGLAKGWTDDDMLKPGTYKVRRSRFVTKPGDASLSNCKVKISMYLDADILEYFRRRAAAPHAAPYQTQINNELRKVMENDSQGTASLENEILNNEAFLRALKEKLATV